MEDPILQVESLIRAMGPGELNAKGAAFCAAFRQLMNKYPFQTTATQQATLQEVNAIFQPGQGALWTFYDASLRNYLAQAGLAVRAQSQRRNRLEPGLRRVLQPGRGLLGCASTRAVLPPRASPTRCEPRPRRASQSLTLTIDRQSLTVAAEQAGLR